MSTQKQKNKEQVRSAVTVAFTAHGWDDYEHWKTADSDIFDKIDTLIKECLGVVRRNPRNFRQPSSSPATSASRSMNLPSVWKV